MHQWSLKMSPVEELHPKAMDLAETAFRYRRRGDDANAKKYFLQALQLEMQAAHLLPLSKDSEPSRSILFRSAASLAYNGADYETANRLIAFGLSGYPPAEIEEELKNLYEDINFMRHLRAKGIELEAEQWLMTLAGNAISYGKTMADIFLYRVERLSTLFYRTVERLLKLPYRTSAGVSKELKDQYSLFINAFLPASFGVSLQIGRPIPQFSLFANQEPKRRVEPCEVIDEVFKCFEILEGNNPAALKDVIEDDLYYENFIALAKQIAPDGDDVTLVGFTTIRNGQERPIALRKSRQQLRDTPDLIRKQKEDDEEAVKTTYKGILRFANSPITARSKFGIVKLKDPETNSEHTIKVPIALMKDVVQPFYEERVAVLVYEKDGKKFLDEINLDT